MSTTEKKQPWIITDDMQTVDLFRACLVRWEIRRNWTRAERRQRRITMPQKLEIKQVQRVDERHPLSE